MSQDSNYGARFIAEAREHLATMTAAMISLEREAADPHASVDQLLRAAHSVKGGAGFSGYRNIERLAHAMEEALENIRDGHVGVSAEVIDILLGVLDRITAMIDDLNHSEAVEIADSLARLQPLTAGLKPFTPPQEDESTPPAGLASVRREDLSESDFALSSPGVAAWSPGGDSLFGIKLDWFECEQVLGLSPLDVAGRINTSGRVLDAKTRPSGPSLSEGMPQAPAWYLAVVASPCGIEEFRRKLDISCAMVAQLRAGAVSVERKPEQAAAAQQQQRVTQPATSLRVSVPLIDRMMALTGELVLVRNQAIRSVDPASSPLRRLFRRLDAVTNELQDAALRIRTQPVGTLFDRFPRMVRDLARQLGKKIEVSISGSEVELDKTILELLADPLTHLIRNCCDHGIETPDRRSAAGKPPVGRIELSARQERGQIVIEVRDDGRGIDPEAIKRKAIQQQLKQRDELDRMRPRQIFDLILLSGFSTAERVTDVSGRGVGMDVVKTNVDQVGGSVEIDSVIGRGTVFLLRLPLTLAIMPCLLVGCGEQSYAVPQRDIEELVLLDGSTRHTTIERDHDGEVLRWRDRLLPVVRLDEVLARRNSFDAQVCREIAQRYHQADAARPGIYGAVIRSGTRRFVLTIDRVQQSENIVVKPLPTLLRPLGIYAATTVLGDGSVSMILNSEGIARHAHVLGRVAAEPVPSDVGQHGPESTQQVMLFRCGPGELLAVGMRSIRRVVMVSRDGISQVGDREMVTVDGSAMNVVRVDHYLKLSSLPDAAQYYLILPRREGPPVGLVASEIVDTVTLPAELDRMAYQADGILGSAIIRGELALLIDIARILEVWESVHQPGTLQGLGGETKRLLVIDDTEFFRKLVAEHLRAAGYTVTVAADGSEGLELMRTGHFDAVVSDVEMPVMDGLTFAKRVRADEQIAATPLLALTTLNTPESRAAAAESGFDGYEVKLDRQSLLQAVSRLLSARMKSTMQEGLRHA